MSQRRSNSENKPEVVPPATPQEEVTLHIIVDEDYDLEGVTSGNIPERPTTSGQPAAQGWIEKTGRLAGDPQCGDRITLDSFLEVSEVQLRDSPSSNTRKGKGRGKRSKPGTARTEPQGQPQSKVPRILIPRISIPEFDSESLAPAPATQAAETTSTEDQPVDLVIKQPHDRRDEITMERQRTSVPGSAPEPSSSEEGKDASFGALLTLAERITTLPREVWVTPAQETGEVNRDRQTRSHSGQGIDNNSTQAIVRPFELEFRSPPPNQSVRERQGWPSRPAPTATVTSGSTETSASITAFASQATATTASSTASMSASRRMTNPEPTTNPASAAFRRPSPSLTPRPYTEPPPRYSRPAPSAQPTGERVRHQPPTVSTQPAEVPQPWEMGARTSRVLTPNFTIEDAGSLARMEQVYGRHNIRSSVPPIAAMEMEALSGHTKALAIQATQRMIATLLHLRLMMSKLTALFDELFNIICASDEHQNIFQGLIRTTVPVYDPVILRNELLFMGQRVNDNHELVTSLLRIYAMWRDQLANHHRHQR